MRWGEARVSTLALALTKARPPAPLPLLGAHRSEDASTTPPGGTRLTWSW